MKSILVLAILFLNMVIYNVKESTVDLKKIADQHNAEYIKSSIITLDGDEKILIAFPDSKKERIAFTILLQGEKTNPFKGTEEFEFVYFEDMLIAKINKITYFFKFPEKEIPISLVEELNKFETINIYGLGFSNDFKIPIHFSENGIKGSFLNSLFKKDVVDLDEDKNTGCGCNTSTVACSCQVGQSSCSVTCAQGSYACCSIGFLGTASCQCKKGGGIN